MKKSVNIIWAAISLICLSCSPITEETMLSVVDDTAVVFYASFGDDDWTKSIMGDNGKMLWKPNDAISIFADGQYLGQFTATCSVPSETTGFVGRKEVLNESAGRYEYLPIEIPQCGEYIAIHPSVSAEAFDLFDSSFSILYPDKVTATTTFPSNNFYSVARSSNHNLSFRNISGALRFSVTQENIDTIRIRANKAGQALAGTARMRFDENGIPEPISMSKCSSELTIMPPSGGFFETDTYYYVTLPPGTYSMGLTFDIETPYSYGSRNVAKEVTISRSEIALLTDVNKNVAFTQKEGNDSYFSKVHDTFDSIGGCNGLFIYSPYRTLFNICGDDMYSAGEFRGDQGDPGELDEFTYNASNSVVNAAYQNFLNALLEANTFLHFQYGYSSELDTQISEVRVMRAFCQMMLTIGWHNPPLYSSNKPDLPNSPYLDNLKWCAKECVEAAEYLPERLSTQDKEGAYKVTKGFALAVAGKALLFAGDYSNAKKHLKSVIDSGKYALVPGNRFLENFHIEGDGNEEKIYEANIEDNPPSGNVWSGNPPFIMRTTWMESNRWNWRLDHFQKIPAMSQKIMNSGGGWGGCGIVEDFAEKFLENDGHSARFDATVMHIDDVIYGLSYDDSHIDNMSLEDKKNSTEIGLKQPLYSQSFFLPFKPIVSDSDTSPYIGYNIRLNNFTFMRYAEVLLMYAECCIQTGDNAEAKVYINKIQERAGSKTISNAVDMDVLKAEKKYELWLEGCRWADLVRWGDTDGVKKSGKEIPTLYDSLFSTPPSYGNVIWENGSQDGSRFYMVYENYGYNGGFRTGQHEYFPFPTDVLNTNPNLMQNPGW